MVIGLLTLDLHFPQSRSLKDKRRELAGLRDRVRRRFNAAVAELEFQDLWQRSRIGIVTLNGESGVVERDLEAMLRDVEAHLDGLVAAAEKRLI